MKNENLPIFETIFLLCGEIAVSVIVCLIYFIAKRFSLSVVWGTVLGTAVVMLNFLLLTFTTNRAIDKVMSERGEGEMDEETAEQFAKKHQSRIQAAVKISYVIRSISIVAALVCAFLIDDVFDVIATLVPLLMQMPILSFSQLVSKQKQK